MKAFNYILLFVFAITVIFASCTNEVQYKPVKINSVWTNQADTFKLYGAQHEINSMGIGKWIRINGTGFTGLKQVLCNGVIASFNTTYYTDENITLFIPSTTPVPGDSTLTVITNHGEYTLKPFVFK